MLKEKFIKDSKELFPFHYGNKVKRSNPIENNLIPANFNDVCESRNIKIGSNDYILLKKFFDGTLRVTNRTAYNKAYKLALDYFPEMRLGSVQSNSKRQEDNGDYVTKNNYKIDASKVVRLKDLPSGAENLSIIATRWPAMRVSNKIKAINGFWDMVCNQKQVKTIICLAKSQEDTADDYTSPEIYGETKIYGRACYKVIEKKQSNGISGCSDVEVYDLTVQHTAENGQTNNYVVKWYHYKDWPDGGIPEHPEQFEEFLKYLDERAKVKKLVVHCHAGAGRTGVLCACLYALRSTANNAAEIIRSLRTYRTQMVQQLRQFEFVYKFILRNIDKADIDYKDDLEKYLENFENDESVSN